MDKICSSSPPTDFCNTTNLWLVSQTDRETGTKKDVDKGVRWGWGWEEECKVLRCEERRSMLVQVTDFNVTQWDWSNCVYLMRCTLKSVSYLVTEIKTNRIDVLCGQKPPSCLQFGCYLFRPTWAIIKELQLTKKKLVYNTTLNI